MHHHRRPSTSIIIYIITVIIITYSVTTSRAFNTYDAQWSRMMRVSGSISSYSCVLICSLSSPDWRMMSDRTLYLSTEMHNAALSQQPSPACKICVSKLKSDNKKSNGQIIHIYHVENVIFVTDFSVPSYIEKEQGD